MVNQALFDVVKNQLASGVSKEEVKEFLHRRGTGEDEISELFEALAAQSVDIRDIPVQEPAPAVVSSAPAPAVAQTEAHGIVRDIPPLQPSVPFAPPAPLSQPVAEQPVETSIPATSEVVFAPQAVVAASGKKIAAWVGGGVVALIALLLGGYVAYSSYFMSPERVMDTMISRLRDVRSGAFAADITVVTSRMHELAATSTQASPLLGAFAVEGPVTIALHASGTIDVRDEQKPQVALAFAATMDKWPRGDFALGAEYRNIDRMNYAKLVAIPDLGFIDLRALSGQWFKAADGEAKAQLGIGSSQGADAVVPAVSQSQRDRLVTAWKANRFLAVAETMEPEDIDGVPTRHYKLAFDKEAFGRWSAEADSILNRPGVALDRADFDKSLDAITIHDLEVWIGKRDGLPHKLVVRASLADPGDPTKVSEVAITVTGNRFNDPFTITAPDGARSFDELLSDVFGRMIEEEKAAPPTTQSARNDRRRSDVAAIADAIKKNMSANGGSFACSAGPLPAVATFIGAGTNAYDVGPCLVPVYLQALPRDPTKGTATMSGYSLLYNAGTNKVTVRAPYAEGGVKITITK